MHSNERLGNFYFNQFAYVSIDEELPTRGELTQLRQGNDALLTSRLFLMQADDDNTDSIKSFHLN